MSKQTAYHTCVKRLICDRIKIPKP